MEKLTNSSLEFVQRIKEELLSLSTAESENEILSYLFFPAIGGNQLSIHIIEDISKNRLKIIQKIWDAEYDMKRFSMGIYNVDRICIRTIVYDVSINTQRRIENLIEKCTEIPESFFEDDRIIIDGFDCELILKRKERILKYQWKEPFDKRYPLEILINELTNITK